MNESHKIIKNLERQLRESASKARQLETAEARQAHIKQVLLAIRNVNQLITSETDALRLIEKACVQLTETLGYKKASIALYDPDKGALGAIASSGFHMHHKEFSASVDAGELPECILKALQEDENVQIHPPEKECGNCPLAQEFEEEAGLICGLHYKNRCYGILSVALQEDYATDNEEQALFRELADDLAYALKQIENETRRKTAQEHLDTAMRIINTSPAVAFVWRNQKGWPVDFVSENCSKVLGFSPESFINAEMNYADIIHPEDIQRVETQSDTAAAENTTEVLNPDPYRVVKPDGKIVWVDERTWIQRDHTGAVTHYQGLVMDISERMEMEAALQDSEKRLRESQRTAKIGYVDFNAVTGEIIWSDMMYQLYERDPSLGPPSYEEVMDLHQPSAAKALHHAVAQALENAEPYDLDLETKLPSGRRKIYHSIGTPIQDPQGKVINIKGTVQDITRRKRAEEALRESEERFAIAFKSNPAPLVISERETGLFVDVNDRWVEMLEWTRDEQIGKTSIEVGIWRNPADRWRIVKKIPEEGRFQDEPITFKTKSGHNIYALWSGEVIRLSGQDVMLSMITDITQLKRAETEREKLRDQLTQSQKMESIGRLAGGVAHDFNNMLNVILGHSEMVLEDLPEDSVLREDLRDIQSAARRSAELTRQLLAFARKQTIAPEVLNLNKTVESMLKMLGRLIGEDIDLIWQPGADLYPIRVDPAQIDQLLANLIVNARDAIGHETGKIIIETAQVAFNEDYVTDHPTFSVGDYTMLAVSDDGCGMSAETKANIFEPFFTTKEVGEGTGLGLATVYGIVKQNHGFINVYSEPEAGSSFRIYIPSHNYEKAGPATEPHKTPTAHGRETILLVEDESSILQMTRTMLQRLGYTVLTAQRPGKAIDLARNHPGDIHLVLTDVVMPEMNGRDLAKNLMTIYPGIKRLFMSGYTANVIAHQGVLDEGVNFIQKPFSRNDLSIKVRNALDS